MTQKQAFESVFLSHRWGNSTNSGKNYVRPYNKTHKQREKGAK